MAVAHLVFVRGYQIPFSSLQPWKISSSGYPLSSGAFNLGLLNITTPRSVKYPEGGDILLIPLISPMSYFLLY